MRTRYDVEIMILQPDETSEDGTPPAAGRVLAEDYYVRAFMTVLDVVEARHADVLSQAERAWSAALRACPERARRLYIRLATRRGTRFRLSKLRYAEIDDIASAAAELVDAGLASDEAPTSLEGLLAAFTVDELDRLLDAPAGAGRRRAGKVRALLRRDASADRAALAAADAWIGPAGLAHFATFRLCFFGNLHQDLAEFVLQDLGAVRYESYALDASSRFFRTREQIVRHLRCHECELAREHVDRTDPDALRGLIACLPARLDGDVHLERRLDRLRNALARDLERLALPDEALHVYANTCRPPARERRVRLLLRAERADEARAACDAMAAAPRSEAEREFAERTLLRLRPGPRARAWRPVTTVLTLRDDGLRVERSALEYYARSGRCYWLENGLVRSVLGLYAWDLVFADVPGAFFNPFQSAPADFREGFREARREALAHRLAELDGADGATRLRTRVLATLESRRGVANPLVRWGRLSREALELALERVPPAHWKALFDRMLDDLSEHVSGLPDLVRFPDAGGYELIEIKGPGDALQQHQRRWLRHFDRHGIPARVVHVRRVARCPLVPPGPGMPSEARGVACESGTKAVPATDLFPDTLTAAADAAA